MSTEKNERFEYLIECILQKYQNVERLISAMESVNNNTDRAQKLTCVKQELEEVKRLESELGPLRESMKSKGQSYSDKAKRTIDQAVALVGGLVPKIAHLESLARVEREKLAPKIHSGVRAMKMQSAYARNR